MPEIRKYKITLRWPPPCNDEPDFELFVDAYDAADAKVQVDMEAQRLSRLDHWDSTLVRPCVYKIEPVKTAPAYPPLCELTESP